MELGIGLRLDELGSAACAMGVSPGCHMDFSLFAAGSTWLSCEQALFLKVPELQGVGRLEGSGRSSLF